MMVFNCLTNLIQYHIFKIISFTLQKKRKTITDNLPIHIYMSRINIKLVLKIKDRITHTRNQEVIWQHKKINRRNKECGKCTVLKCLKQF